MGVDFEECEDCGECVYDQNITYVEIPGVGSHKTCSVCLKKYFYTPDGDDDDLCVEVLEDAAEEEGVVFFCVYYDPEKDRESYTEKDFFATSPCGSNARGWLQEPEYWFDKEDNYENGRQLAVGFYPAWKDKPKKFYVYDPEDGVLPILEGAAIYDKHHENLHGYSQIKSYSRDGAKPNARWKKEQLSHLDGQISHLQDKRRRVEKL